MQKHNGPVVDKIEEIVGEVPGWSPLDQLFALFNLAYLSSGSEGDILEIGSWCGRSAAVLGLAARLTGKSKVFCIDLFPERDDWKQNADGSYSIDMMIDGKRYRACHIQTCWKEPFDRDIAPLYAVHGGVLEIFRETMERNALADIVTPLRGDSTLLHSKLKDRKFKLAFLDGDHSYEAVCADIKNVNAALLPGGWLCFDDAFTMYEGIDRAITELVINSSGYDRCQQLTRKFFVARKVG